MKNILMAYNLIIKDSILDFVPKIILTFYIYEISEGVENFLVSQFTQKDQLEKSLVINR